MTFCDFQSRCETILPVLEEAVERLEVAGYRTALAQVDVLVDHTPAIEVQCAVQPRARFRPRGQSRFEILYGGGTSVSIRTQHGDGKWVNVPLELHQLTSVTVEYLFHSFLRGIGGLESFEL